MKPNGGYSDSGKTATLIHRSVEAYDQQMPKNIRAYVIGWSNDTERTWSFGWCLKTSKGVIQVNRQYNECAKAKLKRVTL